MFKKAAAFIMLAQLPLGWEWLQGAWEKLAEGSFGGTFAASLPKVLGFFTTQPTAGGGTLSNPHTWYVTSFLALAKNNATLFGYLIVYGELFVGLSLLSLTAYYFFSRKEISGSVAWLGVFALIVSAFMNANFYFAAGWAPGSVSTAGVNLVMGYVEIIFAGYYLTRVMSSQK